MENDDLYTWETEYERSWEAIREDEEGRLETSPDDELYKAKRRRLFEHKGGIKLGMMRHLMIVLDASRSMDVQDLRPDRLTCCRTILESFVQEFFDQNPLSQVGLIVTRNGKAEKISDLAGNPRVHKEALKKCPGCAGESSLQNALDLALKSLQHVPLHSSREVLIVHGSLTSSDPGDIFATVDKLVQNSVRCSIVGVAAEVRLCRNICQRTHGLYRVILDESHLKDLIFQHCWPPVAKENAKASLIKMGFPQHSTRGALGLCMCHLDGTGPVGEVKSNGSGFQCPQCKARYCDLPVECHLCGLMLVLAPHIARTYHHLFPLDTFTEQILGQRSNADECCCGCSVVLKEKAYCCPRCSSSFCIDCDLYCHETLHNCPGCQSHLRKTSTVV